MLLYDSVFYWDFNFPLEEEVVVVAIDQVVGVKDEAWNLLQEDFFTYLLFSEEFLWGDEGDNQKARNNLPVRWFSEVLLPTFFMCVYF